MAYKYTLKYLEELENNWQDMEPEKVIDETDIFLFSINMQIGIADLDKKEVRKRVNRLFKLRNKAIDKYINSLGEKLLGIKNIKEKQKENKLSALSLLTNKKKEKLDDFTKRVTTLSDRLDATSATSDQFINSINIDRDKALRFSLYGSRDAWRITYALSNSLINKYVRKDNLDVTLDRMINDYDIINLFKSNLLSIREAQEYVISFNTALKLTAQYLGINVKNIYLDNLIVEDGVLFRLELESQTVIEELNSIKTEIVGEGVSKNIMLMLIDFLRQEQRRKYKIPQHVRLSVPSPHVNSKEPVAIDKAYMFYTQALEAFLKYFKERDREELSYD